jgi:hypothetical protein
MGDGSTGPKIVRILRPRNSDERLSACYLPMYSVMIFAERGVSYRPDPRR